MAKLSAAELEQLGGAFAHGYEGARATMEDAGEDVADMDTPDEARAALKALKLQLDQAGYSEKALRAAWHDVSSQDIAASIIGFIRQQVLGTPLLSSVFRDDRWVYVFSYKQPSGRVEQRKVVVRFRGEQVESIEADDLPQREDPTDPALPGSRAAKSRADDAARSRVAEQRTAPTDKESSR